jgi:pilus assembly protein CpaB
VLQDVEVLATGQKIEPDPEGKPTTATVVTLLVSPEDAEKGWSLQAPRAQSILYLEMALTGRAQERSAVLLPQLTGIAAPHARARFKSAQVTAPKPYSG